MTATMREMRLFTNARMEANVRLYRNCGFHDAGRRPHPSRAGEFLLDMAKLVPALPRQPTRAN